jgi:hypothetical protein
MKKSIRKTTPSLPVNPAVLHEVSEEREDHTTETAVKIKYSSDESSDEEEEDIRMLEGNVYTKDGIEVTTMSMHARLMPPRGDVTAMVCLDLEEERRQREAHQGGNRGGSGDGGRVRLHG